MSGKTRALNILALVALIYALCAESVSAQLTTAESVVCTVVSQLKMFLTYVAGVILSVVIALQGIRWTASLDDAGARKKSKEAIVHAVVGLAIVVFGVYLVTIIPFSVSCPLPPT